MEKFYYENIDEILYKEVLPNGLTVFLNPKKEFNKTYAIFTTKYGSLDNYFFSSKRNEMVKVPDGIAHFLEHKMFDLPNNIDAFSLMSEIGANSNAFTSLSRTSYLFSITSNVAKATEILLDFVQTPYFTEESIKKERGIIEQEIKMYNDYQDFKRDNTLLKNMFFNHPVKIDIAGTVESIAKIDKDLLYECYDTFYTPGNMNLFITGNFSVEEISNVIKNNQDKRSLASKEIKRGTIEEPDYVVKKAETIHDNVFIPKVAVGVKLPKEKRTPLEQMKYEFYSTIYLSILFGESSEFYQEILNSGLINETFDVSDNHEEGLDYITITSDTTDPNKLVHKLIEALSNSGDYDFKESDFIRIRNSISGNFISLFNSLEALANIYTRYYMMDMDLFDAVDVLENLDFNGLITFAKKINKENISSVIVLPKQHK